MLAKYDNDEDKDDNKMVTEEKENLHSRKLNLFVNFFKD